MSFFMSIRKFDECTNRQYVQRKKLLGNESVKHNRIVNAKQICFKNYERT